jgi:hypothetical protein
MTGLLSLPRSEPGIVPVGVVATAAEGLSGMASAPATSTAGTELDPKDMPGFGIAMNGTPVVEVAAVIGDEVPTTRD